MPDLPQEFGPYTLQELIARGGMAEIYRASMPGIGGFEKTVAIKKILPHLAEDDEFIDMLVDEAQIIEKLDHSNIAQVFDLGEIDGSYYIAMEYIHGIDLSAIIDELGNHDALLPYEHTTHILANICDGLHFAHNKTDDSGEPLDVIHRDISPHNVMLSFAGDVKIIDFGVAKAADQKNKTESGTIKGKLLYMAPEQAKSDDELDGRADLFAVGLCAYNMLTDTLPFRGDNEFEVYDNVLNAEIPPPKKLQPDVPQTLNDIVMKLLRRDPAERYQTGYEAQQAFESVLHEIAPGYTVTRLSNFVEENFSHLLHEQSTDQTSAPDQIPEGTPSPDKQQTGERNLESFPSKADTSDASAQKKARRQTGNDSAPESDPHRQPVAESVPDDDLHEERTRAVAPDQLMEQEAPSNPSARDTAPPGQTPSASNQSPQSSPEARAPADEPAESAGTSGLTPNQKLLIAIGVVTAGIIGIGAYLYLSPNSGLGSPTATANASGATDETAKTDKTQTSGSKTRDESKTEDEQPTDDKQPAEADTPTESTDTQGTVVSIDSVPSGARLFYDGSKVGTTPHDFSLKNPDGPVGVTLKKDGFDKRTVEFLPVDGAQKTFELKSSSDESDDDAEKAESAEQSEEPDEQKESPSAKDDEDDKPKETSSPTADEQKDSDDDEFASPPADQAKDEGQTSPGVSTSGDKPDAGGSGEIMDPFAN